MELVHNTHHLVLVCPLLITQDWLELEDSLGTMPLLPSVAPHRLLLSHLRFSFYHTSVTPFVSFLHTFVSPSFFLIIFDFD